MKRHKCCKCGRKRKDIYLKNNFMNQINWEYKTDWCNYPRRDSYKCLDNCLAFYSQEVQVTSVKK